mmetsp:Transcript_1849/g.5874  ORF Transcript_1849/g.5874 Transcript_1849/m.5874 type:complete len:253 (+) Transcript_1849:4218-4976(+)
MLSLLLFLLLLLFSFVVVVFAARLLTRFAFVVLLLVFVEEEEEGKSNLRVPKVSFGFTTAGLLKSFLSTIFIFCFVALLKEEFTIGGFFFVSFRPPPFFRHRLNGLALLLLLSPRLVFLDFEPSFLLLLLLPLLVLLTSLDRNLVVNPSNPRPLLASFLFSFSIALLATNTVSIARFLPILSSKLHAIPAVTLNAAPKLALVTASTNLRINCLSFAVGYLPSLNSSFTWPNTPLNANAPNDFKFILFVSSSS